MIEVEEQLLRAFEDASLPGVDRIVQQVAVAPMYGARRGAMQILLAISTADIGKRL